MTDTAQQPPLVLSPGNFLWNLLLLAMGSALSALAVNGILIPQHFVTSGIKGLALIIHRGMPEVNVGLILLLLNVPLFLLAWMAVGRRFFFYSLIGLFFLAASLLLLRVEIPLHDKLLSALLAGLLNGIGIGITLRSLGSFGGMEILSVMLLRRFSITMGNTTMAVNGVVLVLVAFLYSLEALLYSLIVIAVSARMIDLVVTGLSQRKAVFIISHKWEEISAELLKDIRHGVTLIRGEGGYSREKEYILYTVIGFQEVGQVKRLIQRIDSSAFVVVSDTQEVMNPRIGNQPHW